MFGACTIIYIIVGAIYDARGLRLLSTLIA